jgi:outer membrane protein assembly factor BamB
MDSQLSAAGARLIGVDLNRDGLLTFNARPDDGAYRFDGAPVSDGDRVWIALRRGEATPRAYVACYDATSGAELWRTSIGAADSPGAARGDEITHDLLTLVGDRLFFNTNLGIIAALDANTGRVAWLHRYDRAPNAAPNSQQLRAQHFDRDPSPCLYHGGLVIAAPADTSSIFALDALTGQTLWTTSDLPDALHLLGVVGPNLVVTGNRFSLVDVRSGSRRLVWPESDYAGIRGFGRGLLAGEEVFWPTRKDIYVLGANTGQRTRNPISLKDISDAGANLAAAHNRLIIAGQNKLTVFAPPTTNN